MQREGSVNRRRTDDARPFAPAAEVLIMGAVTNGGSDGRRGGRRSSSGGGRGAEEEPLRGPAA